MLQIKTEQHFKIIWFLFKIILLLYKQVLFQTGIVFGIFSKIYEHIKHLFILLLGTYWILHILLFFDYECA